MNQMTILVPVFNEEENIARLSEELLAYQKQSSVTTHILFIDDGSDDQSLEKIKEFCAAHEGFHFISFLQNRGLSSALKAGFDHVTTPLTAYIDADLQTSPQDFERLLPFVDDHALVNGVRQNRQDSVIKKMSSVFANRFRRMFTRDGMDDTGCPLKIIHTEYARRIPMFSGMHRFLPAMILLQKGSVCQVPVNHFPRIAGKAKFGLRNRLWGPLLDCFAYLWMKKRYINYEINSRG